MEVSLHPAPAHVRPSARTVGLECARAGRLHVRVWREEWGPDRAEHSPVVEENDSADGHQPVTLEPDLLGVESLATALERPEDRAGDGRQIGKPAALAIRLNMAGPDDHGLAQRTEV